MTTSRSNKPTAPRALVSYQSERGLDTLFHRELKATPPGDFNDPFEFRLAPPSDCKPEQLEKHYLSQTAIPWQVQRPKHPSDEAYNKWVQEVIKLPPHKHAQLFGSVRDMMIEVLGKHRGVVCFSALSYEHKPPTVAAAKTAALMWAHYTDKHRGLMIEFNLRSPVLSAWIGSEWLFKVHYHQDRPLADLADFDLGPDDGTIDRLTKRWASQKYSAWSYEREWRLICPFAPPKNPKGFSNTRLVDGKLMHFAALRSAIGKPSSPWLETEPVTAVKRVVLGARSRDRFRADVLKVLDSPAYQHVHIQEARLCPQSFGLDYVDIRKPS